MQCVKYAVSHCMCSLLNRYVQYCMYSTEKHAYFIHDCHSPSQQSRRKSRNNRREREGDGVAGESAFKLCLLHVRDSVCVQTTPLGMELCRVQWTATSTYVCCRQCSVKFALFSTRSLFLFPCSFLPHCLLLLLLLWL